MKTTLFILALISIFPLCGEDLFTPKINHGELTRLDINSIASTLGISEDEVVAYPPEIDGFGPIDTHSEYKSQIYVDSMIPRGFFKQEIKEENLIFYRIMYEVNRTNELDYGTTTYQRIYYQDKETGEISLSYEDYMNFMILGRQLSTPEIQKGVMLIVRNGSYDGVMIYRLWNEKIYEMEGPPRYDLEKKHEAFVYFFKEGNKTAIPGKGFKPDITITASNPLLDGDDIFKYTIQNAFDQNPATSYVEDTEDDLIYISFKFNKREQTISYIRIINGFAVSKYYLLNNRIKDMLFTINLFNKNDFLENKAKLPTFTFIDDNLNFQIIDRKADFPKYKLFPTSGFSIAVESVYSGTQWNDTCIAELDLKQLDSSWILGGDNE